MMMSVRCNRDTLDVIRAHLLVPLLERHRRLGLESCPPQRSRGQGGCEAILRRGPEEVVLPRMLYR